MFETRVVVVGAGYAGLAAARRLREVGIDVRVVEARERVGGRVHTKRLPDGTPIDLGGQWMGPGQDLLRRYAREAGIPTYPTYNRGWHVFVGASAVRRYRGLIPGVGLRDVYEVGRALLELELMARRVPARAPWTARKAAAWDGITLRDWLDRRVRRPVARGLVETGITAVFAAEPEELSLLFALFYMRSGTSFSTLLAVRGGAQETKFEPGAGALAEQWAAALGDRLHLGRPVHRVEHAGAGVTVHAGPDTFRAERAIVAIPPPLWTRIAFEPPLPGDKLDMAARMRMGAVIKWHAVFEEAFWRAEGLSGQVVSDHGPVRVCFDNSPPGGRPGLLVGFFEGRAAREAARWSPSERAEHVRAWLGRAFGAAAQRLEHYEDCVWMDEPWSLGGYAGLLGPHGLTRGRDALRRPTGRLHWAGTETSDRWYGYIEGALRSGERAAAEVLEALAAD